ncbi:ly6/PLAUR domain-containing protein 2-like [Ptychodera flava]|uniref:ly6/PLAUR domain-containing protein 2-like n=1 Tax=Ptychodera flava TaxID=63121 RepID=UPI003969BD28
MSGLVVFILILGFASNLSVALKCYVCEGVGAGCQTDFMVTDQEQECGSYEDHRCQVIRTENDGKVIEFARTCVAASKCEDGCGSDEEDGDKASDCKECCKTDLCNTGNTGVLFTPIVHLLVGGTVMALAMSVIMSG